MDYNNYNNYNRGYTETSMTSADYMTRTYRWMALGLLITFAAAFVTATLLGMMPESSGLSCAPHSSTMSASFAPGESS